MTDTTPAPTVWPYLSYSDERAAICFLVEAFGFEETLVVPGDRDGEIVHVELHWPQGGGIMFGSGEGEFSVKPGNESLYVVTEEPDTLFERAAAAGAEVVRGLKDEDYSSFTVRDPEAAHVLHISGHEQPGTLVLEDELGMSGAETVAFPWHALIGSYGSPPGALSWIRRSSLITTSITCRSDSPSQARALCIPRTGTRRTLVSFPAWSGWIPRKVRTVGCPRWGRVLVAGPARVRVGGPPRSR